MIVPSNYSPTSETRGMLMFRFPFIQKCRGFRSGRPVQACLLLEQPSAILVETAPWKQCEGLPVGVSVTYLLLRCTAVWGASLSTPTTQIYSRSRACKVQHFGSASRSREVASQARWLRLPAAPTISFRVVHRIFCRRRTSYSCIHVVAVFYALFDAHTRT